MWALSILIILVFFGALYVTRFIIIVYTVNKNRGNVLQSAKRRKLPIKTMIVAGSGKNFLRKSVKHGQIFYDFSLPTEIQEGGKQNLNRRHSYCLHTF